MPLIRRQPFLKSKPPPDLKPQDEVFYCKLTNEIFKDYEAFFERIILCNSLVWSCAITGRTGLTYQEALECEAKARKSLGAFPVPLRRPTLCLAALTRRTRLNDMNEDVYSFMKDRYFVGEHVDVIHRNQRRGARVVKVIVAEGQQDSDDDDDCMIVDKPSPDVVDLTLSDSSEASGSKKVSAASSATSVQTGRLPPADGYHYMVQFTDRKETVTVRADQVLRKKGTCTREKSKLFLKQHCEPGDGIWRLQNRFLVKFKIGVKAFEEVFSGPRPSFQVAVVKKRPHGTAVKKSSPLANGSPKESKKTKGKFSKDADSARKAIRQLEELEEQELKRRVQKKALTPQEKARLLEQLRLEKQRQREAERTEKIKAAEQMKAERKNFRDAERMRRLEEQRVRSEYLREWSKPRDDLSCDDLKPLPEPVPVSTSIPEESFGDALMLVEFFRTFDNIVNVSDVFTEGVSLEVLERVLKEKDLDGPLFDLVKVLLTTVFELQEEENIEEEEMVRELKNMAEEDEKPSDASSDTLIRMATRAAQVPMDCHNTALSKLSLDPYTVTEILRLHLLSSGARASVMNAAFRYQERGGFTSLDDAGFDLTKKEPNLLNQLALRNIFDLDSADKMKLLVTLTDQIMSYAAARDVVEDYADQLRMARGDLRQLQLREMRYDKEDQQVRWKRRCEEKAQALAQVQKPAASTGPVPVQTDQAAAGDDSRTSSRIKAQAQNKEEEELQKRLDKLSKKPESILTFSEEGLTPLQVRYLDDKKMEYRAMKREEGREEQRELQAAIINLQHSVGNCPLGRDRMFRRYWVFAGTEGVFVEDDEENVPEDCRKPVRQHLTKNPHHADVAGHEVNSLLRVNQVLLSPSRGKPAFPQTTLVHVPSPSVLQQGPRPTLGTQHTPIKIVQVTQGAGRADSAPTTPPSQVTLVQGAQSPVKMVQSSPIRVIGPHSPIKLTSPGCGSPIKLAPGVQSPAVSTGVQLGSTVRLVPTVGGVAVGPAITGTITSTSASLLKTSPTNDKENVSAHNARCPPNIQRSPTKLIINGSSYAAQQSGVSNSVTVVNGSPSTGSTSPVKVITLSPSKIHSTPPQLLSPTSGQSLLNKPLPSPAVDQILNASRVRWAYIDSPDAIDQLIGALNARGHREKQLKAVLLEKRDELRRRIQDCDKAFFCSGSENDDDRTQKAKMVSLPQNYRKQKSQGIVKDDSAQEQFELTLRELLLDMEERIFFGSLGSIKVSDRPFWRESIEQGSYSAQIEPVWAGMGKAARAERMETDADEAGHAVQDLSKALLQVEQGVDKRYLNMPLGDADKTKKAKHKTKVKEEEAEEEDRKPEISTLERWESSLMSSTSLCQVFLHMTTLESSIAWSKSALHARCRICRRKGDAEQMLLCDMCDRGHHMYCLKPKVTKVPQGDWFCPECRPKDVQRTPRKRARRREEEEEEESLEESSQEEEAEEEEEEEDGQSSQDDEDGEESDDETEETEDSEGESDEETEVVSEEEEEENPEPPKIKLASKTKASKKSPPAPKKASRNSTGSRKSTPTPSTSNRTFKGSESFDLGKKRKAETPPVSRSTKRRSVDVNGVVEAAAARRSPALASSSRGKETWSKLRHGEELVRDMVRMDDSWPFLKPVTRKEAPDYHTIIKTPMDLSKIRMKMNNHEYADAAQLVADVRLMFANCDKYNVPSSDPAKAGVRLAKLFEKKVKEQKLLDGDKVGSGERRSRRN